MLTPRSFLFAAGVVLVATPLPAFPQEQSPVRIASGVSGHIHPAACVTKRGTVVVIFSQSDFKDLRLTRSTDGGRTWSVPVPFPPTVKLSIYPGALTTLADGRILHVWNTWFPVEKGKKRYPQFSLSEDDGKTWSAPRSLPKDPAVDSVLRHALVELGPREWLFPLADRTVVYDPQTEKVTPFADGQKHGLVPIVRTVKSTLVSGSGQRSTDGGKTWQRIQPFPKIDTNGWRFDLVALRNGWLVASEVLGPGFGGTSWRFVVSRDDGQTWDFDGAYTFYKPGRPIGGRACPKTVQLDDNTLGTVFYDTDAKQPGGSGVFFLRTPLQRLAPAKSAAADRRAPLVQVVDLNVGETLPVTLSDGKTVAVKLLDLKEKRDNVRSAVRRAEVTVEVNGQRGQLVSATYHLPTKVGGVQLDCPITKGYYSNTNADAWGLVKDARLRLWPAEFSLVQPGTFLYPVKQRWFASGTQMANEPTFVDGVERPWVKKIYYHSGEDIGGAEGLVEVVAATDGLVVSSGLDVHKEHKNVAGRATPVAPRYDVVYLLDKRGWYYRYSHLQTIDRTILPGRTVRKGDRIGVLGKEGASGGWSHLHFEIKSRQPSGKWGTQASYAFLWEAYRRQYKPSIQAVARPHHLIWEGEKVVLDGSKSWSASGKVVKYEWQFNDGTKATGATVERTYPRAGAYSEVLKVTGADGRIDYDFAVVQVIDRKRPKEPPPGIHAAYAPTFGIRPGDPVTFKVRTFGTTHGKEMWDFGDGSPRVAVRSDGNVKPLAKDGYAATVHRYARPGHYLVRVERSNPQGDRAVAHLHVRVGEAD